MGREPTLPTAPHRRRLRARGRRRPRHGGDRRAGRDRRRPARPAPGRGQRPLRERVRRPRDGPAHRQNPRLRRVGRARSHRPPREFLLRAGAVALAAGVGAAAAGWLAGPLSPVALALLVGIAVLGWQYSVGPLSLSRRGLGELDNSLLGGLVLPLYGAAVVASPDTAVALAVLPFALVVFCNLLATQWPDRRADAAVGKDTLAVRLSAAGIRRLYLLVALLAAVSLLLLAGGAVPTTVALASLSAAPLLLWGAATFPGRPFPTVAAMVVLAVAQTAAWLWVGSPSSPRRATSRTPGSGGADSRPRVSRRTPGAWRVSRRGRRSRRGTTA
ncbi:prenyltransferase [Halosegnis marinus]|uniref:prenyltransferase n=1 Tax=Halosegnis marinus TaxID=3034023 RepID=UPI00361B9823